MTNTFKRSRSTSTASSNPPDPSKIFASKLNKLRSTSLALFSRIASSVNANTPTARTNHLRRERSFSFATSADQHNHLDTLVRDPRLLLRVNRYRTNLTEAKTSTCSIDEHHVLTISNDPSDKKRYDSVIQTQWRTARDHAKSDTLQVPVLHAAYKPTLVVADDHQMTVKSEELTAREFADMTGIKIISDDESDVGSHAIDRVETKGSSLIVDALHQSSITTTSSVHSADWSVKSKPQIWDSGFWQKPDTCAGLWQPCQTIPIQETPSKIVDKPREHQTCTTSEDTTSTMISTIFTCNTASSCASSIDSCLSSSTPRNNDSSSEPPFISQLRRTSCTADIKRNDQGGVIIKKGRFHILLGDAQDADIPSSTTDEDGIREWKRKSFVPAVAAAAADDNTHMCSM